MIRCLSFHAAYRCRHAGACCRAGWTISFDAAEARRVRTLDIPAGGLTESGTGVTIAGTRGGACAFLEDDGLCAIHRIGGHDSLPVSCRMFPRSVLIDARGTFVSLSHFCPSAAALLFEPGPPAAIVDAPPSLVDVGPLDGLDARGAWPPLLRPGVLMDLESYDAWERRAVELLTRDGLAPDLALAALDRVTARIAAWRPGDGTLLHCVDDAFATTAPHLDTARGVDDVAVKRWLAARLFACWLAYQKDGLTAIVGYLHACFRMFADERGRGHHARDAIRHVDLRVMHSE